MKIDPERDALELALLDEAIDRGLPILGICRGAQMLNVFLGGTLTTCIDGREGVGARRRTVLPRLTIDVEPDSQLAGLLGRSRCKVNALHHQAVARAPDTLAVVAHDEHGIVQAIEAPSGPFRIGVQWHPEFLIADAGQQGLYQRLVAAAGTRSGG